MATTKKTAATKSETKTEKAKTSAAKAPATKAKSRSSPKVYTDPELRERLKEQIKAGDKGGKPGQWSARKSQLLAAEYEKAGGGYKAEEKTEAQKGLDEWTDEKWTTADGKPAERESGTVRYLPEQAWEELTPAEKAATNAKKRAGSKAGEQHVPNTAKAKAARKKATHDG